MKLRYFSQNNNRDEAFASRYPSMMGVYPSGSHKGLRIFSHTSYGRYLTGRGTVALYNVLRILFSCNDNTWIKTQNQVQLLVSG